MDGNRNAKFTQRAEYRQRADVYGIEFLHARFVTHRFSRHVHEYLVLGMIETGLQTFDYRGAKERTAPHGIIVLNPDEPHTGESATPDGFSYKALYPAQSLVDRLSVEITGRQSGATFFRQPVIYDAALEYALLGLHRLLAAPEANTLSSESALLRVFSLLIARYAGTRQQPLAAGRERAAVQRVRDYIEAHYDRNLSLSELARLVAFSPYYLARTFTAQIGIPPHAYLESVRIRHAQRLLSGGVPIAEAALATGFPHQSHFTTRFRRAIGITPGQFVKERKIAQDARVRIP